MPTTTIKPNSYRWLGSGEEIFAALIAAINGAQKTVRLEIYIYANDELGKSVRECLLNACERGARVQVLLDAMGSIGLPSNFWEPLLAAGGEVHWFNPHLHRSLSFRDHRKLLVCDEEVAFIGGFNVANTYHGDGVSAGWCDLGLEIISPLAVQLAAAFDEMFAQADQKARRFQRLPHSSTKRDVTIEEGKVLLSGPGRGRNPFARSLHKDFAHARDVRIIAAYFLPTWRIRRDLAKVARRGGRVQLLLAGKSDVFISQLACRSLYRRMLKAGIEVYEYQPQILHAKLLIIDNVVYAGSSNLDPRSLHINYELMLRFEDKSIVAGARKLFDQKLEHCRRIELAEWLKSRTWWRRLKHRCAYFLLVHIDPMVARWGFRRAWQGLTNYLARAMR